MLGITDALIEGQNRPGGILETKGIVIHYLNNENLNNAMVVRDYFINTHVYTSTHYIVDKDTILRCIPDNEIALHTHADSYTDKVKNIFNGENPNKYLIGITICGNDELALKNTIELTSYLLKIHNLSISDLWRYYDIVSINSSPKITGEAVSWELFKNEVINSINQKTKSYEAIGIVNVNVLNVRSGPGTYYSIERILLIGDKIEIIAKNSDWFELNDSGWIYSKYVDIIEEKPIFKLINVNALNVRSSMEINDNIIGQLKKDEQVRIIKQIEDWYEIYYGDSKGYILSKYVQ